MNKCVLICDDDEGILDVAATVIEGEGYKVVKVINSSKVYDNVNKENPGLIIIDLWMPLLSGDEVVRVLKAHPIHVNIPVVVISACPDGKMIAREVGAQAFLPKPFDIYDLVKVVNEYT